MNARHGSFDSTDDEDDSSSIPVVASSTEKGSKEIIDVSTTVREVIRKGGSPLDNLQWSSQLAKNLAEMKKNGVQSFLQEPLNLMNWRMKGPF